MGDLGTLFALQAAQAPLLESRPMTMALCAGVGLATSFALETVYLQRKEGMSPRKAMETALSMSLISMVSMEVAMTATEMHLTGGMIDVTDPAWYAAVGASLAAGFVTPLPYNYYQLKAHGKSCCQKPVSS